MNQDILIILGAALSSSVIGALVAAYFNRSKTSAETTGINITGEISIADAWEKYARKIEDDFMALRKEFAELNKKFDMLKSEREQLLEEVRKKDQKIRELETRIVALEAELKKYQKQ